MKKERIEWIRSKCVDTTDNTLKRVLLIGDSITDGYFDAVSKKLWGIVHVDYLATSYAVDSKIYNVLIKSFIKDSKYDVIHFNHGLHGKHMSVKRYKKGVLRVLDNIDVNTKLILATSTRVLKDNENVVDSTWEKKVIERNQAIKEIAGIKNCAVDDLYPISVCMEYIHRTKDGFHYDNIGYDIFADKVSEEVKKLL